MHEAAQEWGSRGGRGGGDRKAFPSQNRSHISCNDETVHRYTLPKEDPQNTYIYIYKLYI